MQFTSPLFIFIFLPLMTAALAITPARRRRWTILICGAVFYVLANIKTPVSILFLAVSAAFAYCAAYAVYVSRKKPKKTVLAFCVSVCVLMLTVLRILGVRLEAYDVTFLPLGVSVYLLATVSMLIDISRGDAEPPPGFADACLYITFFPVMIAGPIIKYRDFVKLSSEERLDFSLVNVANGYMLFARGFVKRIGISAIMADAYDSICEAVAAEGDLKLGVGAFLVLLMLTNVYFAFSGYSDMGRGLALIMGMKIESDFYYPFAACTPTDYLRRFFRSLGDFLEDYVALPIERVACRGSDVRVTWRKRTASFFCRRCRGNDHRAVVQGVDPDACRFSSAHSSYCSRTCRALRRWRQFASQTKSCNADGRAHRHSGARVAFLDSAQAAFCRAAARLFQYAHRPRLLSVVYGVYDRFQSGIYLGFAGCGMARDTVGPRLVRR